MKKFTLFFVFALMLTSATVFGQARSELNFGLIGVNYEIPVHADITIAPSVATNFDLDWLTLGVRANYYFDNIFGLDDPDWDVYGGAAGGYSIYNGDGNDSSGFDLGLLVGGRWFWNDNWGLYVEVGGGNTQGLTGGIGVTMKL